MVQAIQIGGAFTILGAFALLQTGTLGSRSIVYLLMNLLGSTILAVTAFLESQWGFLMLNTAWALVTGLSMIRRGGIV